MSTAIIFVHILVLPILVDGDTNQLSFREAHGVGLDPSQSTFVGSATSLESLVGVFSRIALAKFFFFGRNTVDWRVLDVHALLRFFVSRIAS